MEFVVGILLLLTFFGLAYYCIKGHNLMIGFLMLRRTPMPYLVAGMRKIHFPQRLIVAVSVTLRYGHSMSSLLYLKLG